MLVHQRVAEILPQHFEFSNSMAFGFRLTMADPTFTSSDLASENGPYKVVPHS